MDGSAAMVKATNTLSSLISLRIFRMHVYVHVSLCVFVWLCICVFAYMSLCDVFVWMCICVCLHMSLFEFYLLTKFFVI